MNRGEVIFTRNPAGELDRLSAALAPDKLFVIMPGSCREQLAPVAGVKPSMLIDDSESAKSLAGAEMLWKGMLEAGLTRKSLVINIGGGVTTDLGGFAAACWMRGIRYINVPTTLLAMVDASAGGKTAVDFGGVKNLIGAFHLPEATLICPQFLATLPARQILSGFGEILKHALLIGPQELAKLLTVNPVELSESDWLPLIRTSVQFKQKIVEQDPRESGLRRILNLGHTAGHAFEALALSREDAVTHGQAVAQGLVTALTLSRMLEGYPSEQMQQAVQYIRAVFPPIPFTCKDYDALLALMQRDKKNRSALTFHFTLLQSPGLPVQAEVTPEDLRVALDITADLLGF